MKKEYDFTGGKRGAVIPSPGKTRITVRIDDDILEWLGRRIDKQGGGFYQTLMNHALREFMESNNTNMEGIVRRVLKEELARHSRKKKA